MRLFYIDMPKGKKPAYLRFADGLRKSIENGIILPGEWLPSCLALSKMVGLHKNTILSGLEELIAEGWIQSEERRGYWVCDTLPSYFFKSVKQKVDPAVSAKASPRDDALQTVDSSHENKIKYHFHGAGPDLREFPFDEFRSCLNDSIRRSGPKLFSYGSPLGYEPLLEQLKEYLRKIRGFICQHLLVTHGSQEAIYILSQMLLSQGDKVAVEELGYQTAWAAFRNTGATLVPIRLDKEGLYDLH